MTKGLIPAQIDRAKGALVGLAIGDALGTTLEFQPRDTYTPLTDMIGGGPFKLKPGQWTDDTAMALGLGQSLLEEGDFDPRAIMQNWLDWYRKGLFSCTGTCFDIGNQTRDAIVRFERTGALQPPRTKAAGNGVIMRLTPIALFALRSYPLRGSDYAITLAGWLAADQAHLTHNNQLAITTAAAMARDLVEGILWTTSSQDWVRKERNEIKSGGYVLDTWEAALWCVQRSDSFEAAVLKAANLGHDADTTAAVTGQLAGATYGLKAIPVKWRKKLAWGEEITRMAARLIKSTTD